MTKPFGIQKFLVRVRNLLRLSRVTDTPDTGIYEDGYLHIDLAWRLVSVAGEPVRFTGKEFSILTMLVSHPSQVSTQTQLLRDIGGSSHGDDTHYLRNFVGSIRQQIRDDSEEPRYLQTEPGVGYRFTDRRQF